MKIVLMGYMASGKSTIGLALANTLTISFLDLDKEIETACGMKVPDIFKIKGEIFFRRKEREVLQEALQSENSFVLSLGGGTPCYGDNLELIKTHTANSFYLKVSIPELVKRLEKEKEHRPLVAAIPSEELMEFVGKHLFERSPFYSGANHVVTTDDKDVASIVKEITDGLL